MRPVMANETRTVFSMTLNGKDICSNCGVIHLPEPWFTPYPHHRPPKFVRVTNGRFAGQVARVQEWSRYGCPLYVRVQFRSPDPDRAPVRENFSPCDLEPTTEVW